MALDQAWLKDRAAELKAAVAFLTRLHAGPAAAFDSAAYARAAWAFPLAGILVGALGAAVYALAYRAGLASWPAAAIAVATTMLLTGCLHEDGLADTADGFGGGDTRERKLEIMRDSRIGTFGVCALVLSILLRVAVLASLANSALVAAALIAAHAAARAVLPAFMMYVPAARMNGLSAGAGVPAWQGAAVAGVLGVLIALVCLGPLAAIMALVLLSVCAVFFAWLSLAQIDGQTGDVLGALEQISEIAVLLVALG